MSSTGLGKIILIYGPMFSGKTDELMSRIRKYTMQGVTVSLIKHEFDTGRENLLEKGKVNIA
jgi:thymidine kinase